MKEARYFYVPNPAVETELPAEEAVHAIRVLRLKEGDEMFLMDGEGRVSGEALGRADRQLRRALGAHRRQPRLGGRELLRKHGIHHSDQRRG